MNFVERIDDRVRIRNVLASTSDKSGLERLVPCLVNVNPDVRIYSTGGTFTVLEKILGQSHAENLSSVSDYTGQPEMQGGLVKTLDFKIYLGLLSETYNPAHDRDLRRVDAVPFDMVVANLYPFEQTVSEDDATAEQARANIDIGGPCMVRAAAKNFIRVAVVTDSEDYAPVMEELEAHEGTLGLETRFELARKAFSMTARYDSAISSYLKTCFFGAVRGLYRTEP